MPLGVIAAIAIVCVILYFYRRSKNWNDLGEAMRIDGGDTPVGTDSAPVSQFHTGDLADQPTSQVTDDAKRRL